MKKIILTTAAVLMLAGCANTTYTPRPVPRYSYQQYPVTSLNIGSIQIVDAYTAPMRAPNAEHLMPEPLPQAVHNWANSRFKATGGDGTLVITIKDASVTGQALPATKGIKGAFTVDQSERYSARINVEFSVDGTTMSGTAGAGSVQVNRGQTIAENASLQDRDLTWTSMAEAMMTDLDAGAQTMLASKLAFLLNR